MTRFVVGVLTAAVVLVVHFGAVLQAQQGVGFLGKSLADWGRDLTSSDPAVRRAAAFAIGNKGPEAQGWASRLSALLDDPDPTVRDAAAFALGKIGPPASLSAQKKLESLLAKDPSASVRRSAAYALGRLGPNGASSAGALAQALKDAEPSVRQNAAYALGELGPDVLLFHNAKLADLLRDPDPLVRRDAAVALGRGGPASAAAVPQLIAALSDADTGVRLNAAVALGNIGPGAAQAIPALTRMIRERANDRDVWREAVVALPKIGPGNAEEIIPGIRPALNHPDPAVRKSAALSFFQHADSEAARATLMDMVPLLKDDDVEVRRAAAAFFSHALKHPDPAFDPVWQPLLEAIQKEQDREVRMFVARSFKAFDLKDPTRAQGRTLLFRLALNDKDMVVRYQLAFILAFMLGADARDVSPTLIQILKDNSVNLVDQTHGLSRVQGGEARGGNIKLDEPPAGDGRVLGAVGLGRIGKAAGPAARKALEEAARDPTSLELRLAAQAALRNFD